MKRIISLMIAVLMSISLSAFAGTTTGTKSKNDLSSIVIPTNITVKQTVTFKDGKTIELYYQKKGDICKLYSTTDVTKYKESDLGKIKSTNFEFVDKVEGKCYITGGNDYSFYRTADGTRHDIGNVGNYPHKKGKGVIPWIVFRKR